jgi:hypothetical protein
VKRLGWVGHVVRTSKNRMIKKVFNTKPEGGRKVGRPRLRWEECVWQDIRILTVGNRRNVASNGEEWGAILRKARADTGQSCQCWWTCTKHFNYVQNFCALSHVYRNAKKYSIQWFRHFNNYMNS